MQAMIPATAVQQWCFPNPPPPFRPSLIRPDIDHYQVHDEVDHDTINGVKISEHVFDNAYSMFPTYTKTPEWFTLSNIDVQIQAAIIDSNKKVEITGILDSSDDMRIVDIDADVEDPLLCPDIANDIFQNLRLVEVERRPRTNYMEKVQKHINPRTRARCVDWLVEVAETLCYAPETLHLAINYLDRYLSGNTVDHDKFRFVGLTCMMIASKYEEVRSSYIDFDAYLSLTVNAFSREDFITMEDSILSYLEYDVTVPTTWSFLERFVRAAQGGKVAPMQSLECMASYLAEISLLSYSMLRFLPSLVAASSVFLAKYILDPSKRPWNATLQHYTTYQPSDLRDCVLALHTFCYKSSSSNMPTIRTKYSQQKYEYVALKSSPPSIPPEVFKNFGC